MHSQPKCEHIKTAPECCSLYFAHAAARVVPSNAGRCACACAVVSWRSNVLGRVHRYFWSHLPFCNRRARARYVVLLRVGDAQWKGARGCGVGDERRAGIQSCAWTLDFAFWARGVECCSRAVRDGVRAHPRSPLAMNERKSARVRDVVRARSKFVLARCLTHLSAAGSLR